MRCTESKSAQILRKFRKTSPARKTRFSQTAAARDLGGAADSKRITEDMRTTIISLAFALATLSAAPALANSACDYAPNQLRSIAANADATAASRAERNIRLGEALCDARNRSEATRKFNLAAKTLGTDLASLKQASSATGSANAQ